MAGTALGGRCTRRRRHPSRRPHLRAFGSAASVSQACAKVLYSVNRALRGSVALCAAGCLGPKSQADSRAAVGEASS